MTLSGMDCIDLMEDVVKILGVYFSYNKKLEQVKNFGIYMERQKSENQT